jgi:acetyl esterase/lipase
MAQSQDRFPGVERRTRAFLEELAASGAKPLETLKPAEARKVLVDAQSGPKLRLPAADVRRRRINAFGESVELIVVRPAGATGTLPAFMFIHGGGWVLGDFPTHERFVRDLVQASGAAAVFVEYERSPEARFPVAVNQCFAATRWVAEHGADLGLDGRRLAVAGNSVGGNMAAVVALLAAQQGGPKLAGQVLFWPVTDARFDTGSYEQFEEGYFLTRSMMRWFWDSYTTDPVERQDWRASPLRAAPEQLAGLPPALVQTAEMDVLRDEGEAYARRLDAAGLEVTAVRYNGLIHDFGLLNVLADVPAVRAAIRQAAAELRRWLAE